MRLFVLLATTVLLAACAHDTDDQQFFMAETGVSLAYYIGSRVGTDQKNHDDPWDTIAEKFGDETVHTRKNNQGGGDDPWDTINDKFGTETVHTGQVKSAGVTGGDDPWDTINEKFGSESVHTRNKNGTDPWDTINDKFGPDSVHTRKGKSSSCSSGNDQRMCFMGSEKSTAVFVSFRKQSPVSTRARIVEVRGAVARLQFADGVEQFIVGAAEHWTVGTQLETGFLSATSKHHLPFMGVRFWKVVPPVEWGVLPDELVIEDEPSWPRESGASLLVLLQERLKNGNDPWDTIKQKFDVETNRTGITKSDGFWKEGEKSGTDSGSEEDPWDTIAESFPLEGKSRIGQSCSSFKGETIVPMVFVLIDKSKKHDDPWDTIGENFPVEKRTVAELSLIEVRERIGRFETAMGDTIFAVGIPAGWTSGLRLRVKPYLLQGKQNIPLLGAVVWSEYGTLMDVSKSR